MPIQSIGVPWLGVGTHFGQGEDPIAIMPLVAASGVGWIRDDIIWQQCETTKGVYNLPGETIAWLKEAAALGLSVLADIPGGNPIYANPYDQSGFVAFVTWLAGALKAYPVVKVVELINEPNNDYSQKQKAGGDWRVHYVSLANAACAAIKLVNPALKVVGLGGNPPDNYFMMSTISTQFDGFTDHPYGWGVMQSQGSTSFLAFDQQWLAECATHNVTTNRYYTEWGMSTYTLSSGYVVTQTLQAQWECARIIEGHARNVTLDCKYVMKDTYQAAKTDNEGNFGWITNLTPKLAYYMVQRVTTALAGLVPSGVWPWTYNTPSNFDWDYRAYGFDAPDGSKSVVAFWDNSPGPFIVKMQWKHPGATSVTLLDPITGATNNYPVNWTYNDPTKGTVEIDNVPVTNSPQLLIIL